MQVLGISSPCHLMLKWELAPQEGGWYCGWVNSFVLLFLGLNISQLALVSCLVFMLCFMACR